MPGGVHENPCGDHASRKEQRKDPRDRKGRNFGGREVHNHENEKPPPPARRRDTSSKLQKDLWDRREHNFQTRRRIVGGVEYRGSPAINRATFAAGTNTVQSYWANVTPSALGELRRKKRDTWNSKPESDRAWTEERRASAREAWASRPEAQKEERKRKQRTSLASTLASGAAAMQRTIDGRLEAAGVLLGGPRAALAKDKGEETGAPAPPIKPKCELCAKFAPNLDRNCPGRDGDPALCA